MKRRRRMAQVREIDSRGVVHFLRGAEPLSRWARFAASPLGAFVGFVLFCLLAGGLVALVMLWAMGAI